MTGNNESRKEVVGGALEDRGVMAGPRFWCKFDSRATQHGPSRMDATLFEESLEKVTPLVKRESKQFLLITDYV
ncbi:predicted protein [Nematostella vectensis]|uniref:Uncharacterized protein n=1 Tax=Nematostella vectensis TaxID=45351 RepID=A7SJM4_NEMVE|nr:predicted protein [Nematostella vectensis]|eukprot:XP_001628151.1 predicted protein [Nematostella vectensis]